jgi:hypothetical protein
MPGQVRAERHSCRQGREIRLAGQGRQTGRAELLGQCRQAGKADKAGRHYGQGRQQRRAGRKAVCHAEQLRSSRKARRRGRKGMVSRQADKHSG